MSELKCPHCGQAFTVDDAELGSIISQIRDAEFKKDLKNRTTELEKHFNEKHGLELTAKENEVRLSLKNDLEAEKKAYEQKIAALTEQLRKTESDRDQLKAELSNSEDKKKIAVLEAVQAAEEDKRALERDVQAEKDKAKLLLAEKDTQIEFYRDLKKKLSTKMVGETLEQHCEIQFNQLRATAFRNAYFEKDNDAKTGSKGDYIYRETDAAGTEIISIMFEMKNENDETASKHKNEDFFKELDKDRKEKNCEYAVLVSMLEKDSDLYDAGIVDVSHKYDKMYVVRPNCFIPIITLLRNAALNALHYKKELAEVRNQNIDVAHFEDDLNVFKDAFSKNYRLAHDHFDKAIEEIDKTIQHLEKVKKELQGSDNQLRLANNKVEDVTVKRLTKNNPTMEAKFKEVREAKSVKMINSPEVIIPDTSIAPDIVAAPEIVDIPAVEIPDMPDISDVSMDSISIAPVADHVEVVAIDNTPVRISAEDVARITCPPVDIPEDDEELTLDSINADSEYKDEDFPFL